MTVFILCKISGRQFRKITTNSTKSKNYSETACCVAMLHETHCLHCDSKITAETSTARIRENHCTMHICNKTKRQLVDIIKIRYDDECHIAKLDTVRPTLHFSLFVIVVKNFLTELSL